MTPPTRIQILLLDEGETTSLDALAVSVAIFGDDRFELVPVPDRDALWRTADELSAADAPAVVVVDVDHHPEPKSVLADAADAGFPLVVLSDGLHDAIADHALSVAAAAYLPTTLPAQELVAQLGTLSNLRSLRF